MQRILSTYRYVNQPLSAALLAEIAQAGFSAVEIFCASQHFSYREPQRVREIGDALDEYRLGLHSMHSPTDRDRSPGRESGVVISISDPGRIPPLEAGAETKRRLKTDRPPPF